MRRDGRSLASVGVQTVLLLLGTVSALEGMVDDARCDVGTINHCNQQLNDVLGRLIASSTFFNIFKVNMDKECPFWDDDGICLSKNSCFVECCTADEVPTSWTTEIGTRRNCEGCVEDPHVETENNVDFRISDSDVWTIQDDEEDMVYVDLRKNPESYTGYRGTSARRAWTAIYEENCFPFAKNCVGGVCQPHSFKEERVLYRLISGVHTSITVSIIKDFVFKDDIVDVNMYKQRIGNFPDRIKNLYFLLALGTRALAKSVPILREYSYATGDIKGDEHTLALLQELWSQTSLEPTEQLKTFDESDMFHDAELKDDFRTVFRNISAVMDCVGCEKCKLWGKLEFLGLGTALKLLFDDTPKLQRNEIIALIQMLYKSSSNVRLVEQLEALSAAEGDDAGAATINVESAPSAEARGVSPLLEKAEVNLSKLEAKLLSSTRRELLMKVGFPFASAAFIILLAIVLTAVTSTTLSPRLKGESDRTSSVPPAVVKTSQPVAVTRRKVY